MDWSLVVGAPFDVGPASSQRADLQRGETPLADKSSFTTEEWTLLLESPMLAGMAITAADPSGLWGLLKESFASGSALAKAMTDPGSSPLVKALATDFSTTEARSAARDGLKAKLANSKPGEVKTKSIETLRQVSAVLGRRPRRMLRPSKAGFVRSAKLPPKRRVRVAACSALAELRSARPRRRHSPKLTVPWGFKGHCSKQHPALCRSLRTVLF